MSETTVCQKRSCDNPATPKPIYDANPDPAQRKQVGSIAICDSCQAKTDAANARLIRR